MTFREALKIRLSLIKPSAKTIENFNKLQSDKFTPYIRYLRNCPSPVRFNGIKKIKFFNF